jgi:3alpha(or 20beta)-hydroxysteroid dehydrogenase
VRVNCILPGLIDTDMARINTPETIAAYIDSLPVGQIGAPEDVARMSAFLASDAACFVTGTDIVVDGGQTV